MDNPETMMQNCVLNVCQPGNRLLSAGAHATFASVRFASVLSIHVAHPVTMRCQFILASCNATLPASMGATKNAAVTLA